MPNDILAGPAGSGTSELSRPAEPGTMTLAATSSCDVEAASPFDKIRAEEDRRRAAHHAKWAKDKSKRTPRQKSPRASARAAVQAKVTPEAGAWRKEFCAYARWLPPHMANELIGAICNADSGGEPVRTTHEMISAYTNDPVIQEWYGCKPVSPRQSERNLPKLKAAGYISCEVVHEYDTWTCKFRSRVVIWFTIENLRNLRAFYEDAVARKEMHKAAEAVRRQEFARELADTKASEETFRNGGQSGGQSGRESGGQSGGCCDSYLYQQPGTANKTATSSSVPGDDDAVLASSPPEEDRRGQAPRTPQEPGKGLSPSDYGAAVCRALGEHLDDPLDPSLFPAAARDLLARLWPDPQDVPAREIAYGHLEDSWYDQDETKWNNEAAVLANRLRYADEALVCSWVERGAQRLAEIAAEQQRREEEAQRAARQERMDEAQAEFYWRFGKLGVTGYHGRVRELMDESSSADEFISKMEAWLADETVKAEHQREQAQRDREQRVIENRIAEFAYRAKRERADQAELDGLMADFTQRVWGGDEAGAWRAIRRHSPELYPQLAYVRDGLKVAKDREWVLKDEAHRAVLEYIRQHPECRNRDIAAGLGIHEVKAAISASKLFKAKLVVTGSTVSSWRIYEDRTQ